MASEYLTQMEIFQKKLHKKVRDVEKKKEEIRHMYQASLEQNLKVISDLKNIVKTKIADVGLTGAPGHQQGNSLGLASRTGSLFQQQYSMSAK